MKDYILIDVESGISKQELLTHVLDTLPEYQWRSGDSDAIGPYVSGTNKENANIKFWLGENPIEVAVSFSSYRENSLDREAGKQECLDELKESITTGVGVILREDS